MNRITFYKSFIFLNIFYFYFPVTNAIQELSDDELEMLANVVQLELDKYDPEQPVETYEVPFFVKGLFRAWKFSSEFFQLYVLLKLCNSSTV